MLTVSVNWQRWCVSCFNYYSHVAYLFGLSLYSFHSIGWRLHFAFSPNCFKSRLHHINSDSVRADLYFCYAAPDKMLSLMFCAMALSHGYLCHGKYSAHCLFRSDYHLFFFSGTLCSCNSQRRDYKQTTQKRSRRRNIKLVQEYVLKYIGVAECK